jgi:hypothetical protein
VIWGQSVPPAPPIFPLVALDACRPCVLHPDAGFVIQVCNHEVMLACSSSWPSHSSLKGPTCTRAKHSPCNTLRSQASPAVGAGELQQQLHKHHWGALRTLAQARTLSWPRTDTAAKKPFAIIPVRALKSRAAL